MLNHYKTLGTHRMASDAEVRTAYGALARSNHPDLFKNDAVKAAAMADLNVAYNVLKNVKARRVYDNLLSVANKACPSCGGRGALSKQRGFTKKVTTACAACGGCGVVLK